MGGTFRIYSSQSPTHFLDLPRLQLPAGLELGREVACNIPKCGALSTPSGDYVVMPEDEVLPGPHLIFYCPRCEEEFAVAAPRWSVQLGYTW
jgi:hypothetical protein